MPDAINLEILTYVDKIVERVNSVSRSDSKDFCEIMSNEHRTHQQSFTRLCVMWLNHVGQVEYRTDPRNEASHQVGSQFLRAIERGDIDPYLPMI